MGFVAALVIALILGVVLLTKKRSASAARTEPYMLPNHRSQMLREIPDFERRPNDQPGESLIQMIELPLETGGRLTD